MTNTKEKLLRLFQTGFFHIFGVNALGKVLAFGGSVLLVRLLSKEDYGVFTYAWNLVSIVLLFSGMGMEPGLLQISSEHSGDSRFAYGAYSYAIRFSLVVDLILAAVLFCMGTFLPLKIKGAGVLLRWMSLLPMAHILYALTGSLFRSQMRNQEYARLLCANSLALLLGIGMLGSLLKLPGIVLSYYLSYLLPFLFGILMLRSAERTSRILQREDRRNLLQISFVSMCTNGMSQLLYLLDLFVLGVLDPQEVVLASYRTATIIPTALVFVPNAFVTYIYPYFAMHRNDGTWCLKHYRLILLVLGSVNAVISLGLVIFAPLIIRILFGAVYMDAVPVFRVLAVNYFFSGTFRILSGNLLSTQRKLKFNLCVAAISGLINIGADFILIRSWGSLGAAVATVLVVGITSIVNTAYLIYTFKKQVGNP